MDELLKLKEMMEKSFEEINKSQQVMNEKIDKIIRILDDHDKRLERLENE